jgi:ribosome-binding factor A
MANAGKTLYEACQDIIKHGQWCKFHKLKIDLFSAQVFVQVYDKLNDQNKNKLAGLAKTRPDLAIKLCYKLVK